MQKEPCRNARNLKNSIKYERLSGRLNRRLFRITLLEDGAIQTKTQKKFKTHGKKCPISVVSTFSLTFCVNPQKKGFPGGLDDKESAFNVGDLASIPGLGRFPAGGCGNPLQYSCLESPMDREAWRAAVHGVTKSQT